MAEPLIFVGAGASKAFGLPTMKDMVSLFEKELESGSEASAYESIKMSLQSSLGNDVDLESVFTIIDGILTYKNPRDLGLFQEYFMMSTMNPEAAFSGPKYPPHDVLSSLRDKFKEFVKKQCTIQTSQHAAITRLYSRLFARLAPYYGGRAVVAKDGDQYRDWSIFTTNYDLCLEYFFSNQNIQIFSGFKPSYITSRAEMDLDGFVTSNAPVKLYKLHGSLSWIRFDDGSIVEYRDTPPQTTFDGRQAVGEVVLYPIQQKATYLPPYINMFYHLSSALQSNQDWVVIGYSFNDMVIRDMFVSNSAPNKRLILVHPHAGQIHTERLSEMKGAIQDLPLRFGTPESIDSIVDAIRKPRT